jgi:hypothetical protein
MKKSIIIITLMLYIVINGNAQDFKEFIDKDISSLQKDQVDKIILFENNCRSSLYYLMYSKDTVSYINVYYIKKVKVYRYKRAKYILDKKEFTGFNSSILWSYYDTCKVLHPKCDTSWTCDDCCGSQIDFYCGKIKTTYYFNGDLHYFCPKSPYIKFINQVSDSIYKFVFDSKRFDIKLCK